MMAFLLAALKDFLSRITTSLDLSTGKANLVDEITSLITSRHVVDSLKAKWGSSVYVAKAWPVYIFGPVTHQSQVLI